MCLRNKKGRKRECVYADVTRRARDSKNENQRINKMSKAKIDHWIDREWITIN